MSVEDFDGTIEYDEEEDGYDPHRVRAHITRGIGAFGKDQPGNDLPTYLPMSLHL